MTARKPGEAVVRVRQIAEGRAAAAAAAAQATASAARVAAEMARVRAKVHPLGSGARDMRADDLLAAAGSAAALRETAAAADRHEAHAHRELAAARQVVGTARAEREAAERFLERRRAAAFLEAARKTQRQLDEAVLAARRPA